MLTNPTAAAVLQGVRQSLMADVMPELQTDRARVLLVMIDTMLAATQKRIPLEQQWMAEECNRMMTILDTCAATLASAPSEPARALQSTVQGLGERQPFAPVPGFEEINRSYHEISAAFTEAIGHLNALEGEGVAEAPALLREARAYIALRVDRDMAAHFAMDQGLVGRG